MFPDVLTLGDAYIVQEWYLSTLSYQMIHKMESNRLNKIVRNETGMPGNIRIRIVENPRE